MDFMKNLSVLLVFLLSLETASASSSTVVDSHLIPDEEEVLGFLNNPEIKDYFFPTQSRPGKCPFKSYNQNELIAQLKEAARVLRNSRCNNVARDLVANLNQMASVLRNSLLLNHGIRQGVGLMYQIPEAALAPPIPYKPMAPEMPRLPTIEDFGDDYSNREDAQAHSKEILRQLMAATSDTKCVEDLHKAGLVSSIADIAVGLGQTALVVPGHNGFAVGVGTLAIAATLKVVSALLKSPYDWRQEKDRMHFLDLNCNFFDLRKELEEADFFDTRGVDKLAKAKKGKYHIEIFDDKIDQVEASKKAFEKSIVDSQNEFFGAKIGKNKMELLQLILKAEKALAENIEERPEARFRLTKELAKYAPKLIILFSSEYTDSYGNYLVKLLEPFAETSLAELDRLKIKRLNLNYVQPIKIYIQSAREEIQREMKAHIHAYENQKSGDDEINREVIERGGRTFDQILKELKDRKGQLLRRISLYEEEKRSSIFGSFENGAHMDFDVLKEYTESRKLILGSRGWGFLRYLIRTADKDIDSFSTAYGTWVNKYMAGEHLSPDMKVWACRDAQHLRVKWNTAFSAVGFANDFYETNRGIFHSEFETVKKFLRVFPAGKSNHLKIYGNIRSLEMAKSIIEGSSDYTRKQVKDVYKGSPLNLGELALKIKDSESSRYRIDVFYKEKNCLIHF